MPGVRSQTRARSEPSQRKGAPLNDPYHDRKKYHMADKWDLTGQVSALCFAKPRAIDLTVALWTMRPEAVTCAKCLRLLGGDGKDKPQEPGE